MKFSLIVDYIIKESYAGRLAPGTRIPSIRELCRQFKCTKSTVVRAYYELKELGIVYSVPGSGYYLIDNLDRINKTNTFIDFSGTSLDVSSLPYSEFQACVSQAINKYKESLFAYGSTQGLDSLIEALRRHLQNHQVFSSSERIFVTTGSQQALDILSRMNFPNGKKNVLIEQPTYQGMIECLKLNNITPIGVSRSFHGLDFDGIERSFRNDNIKFFYTIPRFNNPLGLSYTNADKKRILSLAEKYNVYIVEDDYLGDLESDAKSTPIYSFDTSDRVIYVKTFSKVLIPGLRIAVAVLPRILTNTFSEYKYWSDLNSPLISQGALEIYMNSGMLDIHINKIRHLYSSRMSYLKNLSEKYVSPSVRWHIPGKGCYYAGMEILNGVNGKTAVAGLSEKNIMLSNMENYYLKEFYDGKILRLSVARADQNAIDCGIPAIVNEIESGVPNYHCDISL